MTAMRSAADLCAARGNHPGRQAFPAGKRQPPLRRNPMPAQAGEKAQETGDFRCQRCQEQTDVTKGRRIPKCPHCGSDTYEARYHEPGRAS